MLGFYHTLFMTNIFNFIHHKVARNNDK